MNKIDNNNQIVATVSRQLQTEFDIKGLDEKNVRRMMQFAQEFPVEQMQQIQKSLEAAQARFENFIEKN